MGSRGAELQKHLGIVKNAKNETQLLQAVGSLFNAAVDENNRAEIRAGDGVALLVPLLDHANPKVVERACGAILNLAIDEEGQVEIINLGGTERILPLIDTREEDKSQWLLQYGTGYLVNVSLHEYVWNVVLEKEGVEILHKLLTHENENVRINTMGAFGGLVHNDAIAEKVQAIDHFKAIVDFLDSKDNDALTRVSNTIWNLAIVNESCRVDLCNANAVEKLAPLLDTDDIELLGIVVMASAILAMSDVASDKMRELNLIPKFVELINNPDDQVAQNAVACIWNVSHNKNNEGVIQQTEALDSLLKRLSESGDYDMLEKVLGALLTICAYEPLSIDFRNKDGFDKLMPHLRPETRTTDKNLLYTIVLCAILAYEKGNQDALRECGALDILLDLLKDNSDDQRLEKTTAAILNLTLNDGNKDAIRRLDGIATLVELLYHPNPVTQQNAAGALWNLAQNGDCKTIIRVLGGIKDVTTLIGGGTVKPRNMHQRGSIIEPDRREEAKQLANDTPQAAEPVNVDQVPLEEYVGGLKKMMREDGELVPHLSDNERRLIDDSIEETLDWILSDEGMKADKNQIEKKKNELRKKIEPALDAARAKKEYEDLLNSMREKLKKDPTMSRLAGEGESRKIAEKMLEDARNALKKTGGLSARDIDAKRTDFEEKMQNWFAKRNLEDFLTKLDALTNDKDYKKYMSDEEAQKVRKWVLENQNWLNKNGASATAAQFDEMTSRLQRNVDTVKGLKSLSSRISDALGMRLKDNTRWGRGGPAKDILYGSYLQQERWRKQGGSSASPNATTSTGGFGNTTTAGSDSTTGKKNFVVPAKSKYSAPSKQDEEDMKAFALLQKKVSPVLQAKMGELMNTKNQAKSTYGRVLESAPGK